MVTLIISQRISELYIAQSNRAWALAAGAQEFGALALSLVFFITYGMVSKLGRRIQFEWWLGK